MGRPERVSLVRAQDRLGEGKFSLGEGHYVDIAGQKLDVWNEAPAGIVIATDLQDRLDQGLVRVEDEGRHPNVHYYRIGHGGPDNVRISYIYISQ